MKVYVLYESYYGELVEEIGDSTKILGVYTDLQKAIDKANKNINDDLGNDYVLDNERANGVDENGGYWRLFYGYQGNWDCFYEVCIEVKEVF